MNNFWDTPEVDAWSRDFNYSDYLNLHSAYRQNGYTGKELSMDAYDALRNILEMEMENSFK